MEDVVAIKANTREGQTHYWMTWGRVFGAVDSAELIAAVRPHLSRTLRQSEVAQVGICATLQEASAEPYFYEGLLWISQTRIPFGEGYEEWRREKRERIAAGKDLFYLGQPATNAGPA
jgi:hypothetical protein